MALTADNLLTVLLRERRATEGFRASLPPAQNLDLSRDSDRNTYHTHAWINGYQTALCNLALALLGEVPSELHTEPDKHPAERASGA